MPQGGCDGCVVFSFVASVQLLPTIIAGLTYVRHNQELYTCYFIERHWTKKLSPCRAEGGTPGRNHYQLHMTETVASPWVGNSLLSLTGSPEGCSQRLMEYSKIYFQWHNLRDISKLSTSFHLHFHLPVPSLPSLGYCDSFLTSLSISLLTFSNLLSI